MIAKPLLSGLRLVHGVIGNWGWAIIVLTLLINLVLFPLRVKQQVSMQRMQKLAPQFGALACAAALASLVVVALQRRPVGEYLIEHRLPAPVGWTVLAAALGHRTNELEVGRRLVEATLLDQELRHILV